MADAAGEFRHLLEGLINRQIDDQQAQRGWSAGWDALMAQGMPSGAAGTDVTGIEFATGYDGSNTIVGFTFDISQLDGTDNLL